MTTFAKASFSAASYATFRPTYPPKLYDHILKYHQGPRTTCLDLGCGHGLVARALAPSFARVLATDPSAGMIQQAQQLSTAAEYGNISFRQAAAEDGIAPFASDGTIATVDAAVAGQAAHWFDFDRAWPQLASAIRPGGTLALWCYKDHVFVDYPKASACFAAWINGSAPGQIGPYWEPGRQLVTENYASVRPPAEYFEEEQRVLYEPAARGPRSGVGEMLLQRIMTVRDSMQYLRTWSAVHNWQEAHGNPKARQDGGAEGDVVDRLYDELRRLEGWEGEAGWVEAWTDDLELVLEWGTCILLARRR